MTVAEKLFISVLRDKDEITLSKVLAKWLDAREIKQHKYITNYYRDNGELPGINTFCADFSHDAEQADSRPSSYLKALKERYVKTTIAEKVPETLKLLKKDVKATLEGLREVIQDADSIEGESKDVKYSMDAVNRFREYWDKVTHNKLTDFSTGVKAFDELLYGYNKGDLITIGGRAGSMKTWLLCFLVLAAEKVLPEDANDILVVTNEITARRLIDRMDCIRFTLGWENFKRGTLTPKEKASYRDGLEELEFEDARITVIEKLDTVEELNTKILLYNPSLVFVDGAYLFYPEEEEDWKKITKITRRLKRTALQRRVPIIDTTQGKRGSGKKSKSSTYDLQEDFSFGMSFSQDSDVAMLIYQTPQMRYHNTFGAQIAKGREIGTARKLEYSIHLDEMKFSFDVVDEELEDDGFSSGAPFDKDEEEEILPISS